MTAKSIKQRVFELANPIVEQLGMELVDVEYVKEGKDWYLRVYIYRKHGVSIDDCVEVNNELSAVLDAKDPIENPYILEISSPGLDRPLKNDRDFERYVGEEVEVNLYGPDENNKKQYTGKLHGINKENGNKKMMISIETADGKMLSFEKGSVAAVRRAIVF